MKWANIHAITDIKSRWLYLWSLFGSDACVFWILKEFEWILVSIVNVDLSFNWAGDNLFRWNWWWIFIRWLSKGFDSIFSDSKNKIKNTCNSWNHRLKLSFLTTTRIHEVFKKILINSKILDQIKIYNNFNSAKCRQVGKYESLTGKSYHWGPLPIINPKPCAQ